MAGLSFAGDSQIRGRGFGDGDSCRSGSGIGDGVGLDCRGLPPGEFGVEISGDPRGIGVFLPRGPNTSVD